MTKNIMIVGVGGQGTLLTSRIIGKTALEKGFGHKMGVFRMNDLTGIDLSFTMMKTRYEKTGIKPDMYDIYEKMVSEGKLGRKSGEGFYKYDK